MTDISNLIAERSVAQVCEQGGTGEEETGDVDDSLVLMHKHMDGKLFNIGQIGTRIFAHILPYC